MTLFFIVFLLCQVQVNPVRVNQFNLYHTDRHSMMSKFGHDCLYIDSLGSFPFSEVVRLFCIRSEQSNTEDQLCYETPITFKELKIDNIRIDDLFHWNAVIETIDLYQKYLQFPDLVDDNEVYCNCSSLTRFGKSCQYDANTNIYQHDYYETAQLNRITFLETELELDDDDLTCYVGLRCQINLFCLDWRQICNGIVDCDYGEDEPGDLCLQMETNQCHSEEEFRCRNGLCIPVSILNDKIEICPDLSDGIKNGISFYPNGICFYHRTPGLDCDEINLAWKQFSCFNGESIPYSSMASIIYGCKNYYDLRYLTELFSTNDENQCWKSMFCSTGFDNLYFSVDCSNQMNIEESCPNEFYFPPNSIVYSFVYFLYDQNNPIDWSSYSGPTSICYKKEFCPNYTFNVSTFSKNNLTCFLVDRTKFSWKNFYEYVIHLFSPCFSSSIPINHPMLYQCSRSQSFISIYRLKDKKKDCYLNEDEDENIDLCSFNTNDLFKCLSNQSQCVRQPLLRDKEYDCADGSDEYFPYDPESCYKTICKVLPSTKRTLPEIYRFHELCDNIVDRHLFSLESKETDETDCEHWPYTCDSYYTRCNQIWNCPNGQDEFNCELGYGSSIQKVLGCQSNEHYCIQLINHVDVNPTCIHINRTGDGIIDCIGGTDERFASICKETYPIEFDRRFHCMNSNFCIGVEQVCDRIKDCPYHDDELICPWSSEDNSSTLYCETVQQFFLIRCTLDSRCPRREKKENIWFCDLSTENTRILLESKVTIEPYPPIGENNESISFSNADRNQLSVPERQTLSFIGIFLDSFLCNSGYSIKSSIVNNETYCLCPPSHYGDYCQYQSERVTALLRLQIRYPMNPLTVFRLIIYLFNEKHRILSYDQFVFSYVNTHSVSNGILLVYLMSERMRNLSLHQHPKSKFVRIDSYIIKETNVRYISSWFFPVSFPFLPVNRLAANLRLVNESFKVIYCKKRCGSHGKCLHYINAKDKEYCWCNQGWFGEHCEFQSSYCNSTSCSPHSQCVILDEEKQQIECICPLGKSGDQCYITRNPCSSNPCQNNGTCLPLGEKDFQYSCICHDDYDQLDDCEYANNWCYISFDSNVTNLLTIPAVIISMGITNSENTFNEDPRVFYKDVALPHIFKISWKSPDFVFVQVFHNSSKSSIYVVLIGHRLSESSVNSSVISQNVCPNVNEIFNQTILNEYSYLKRLKLYHLPCNHNHNLRCFFDQYRMCMCTTELRGTTKKSSHPVLCPVLFDPVPSHPASFLFESPVPSRVQNLRVPSRPSCPALFYHINVTPLARSKVGKTCREFILSSSLKLFILPFICS